jgi:3-oxoacyl-[acyl-carrier protein] reductase
MTDRSAPVTFITGTRKGLGRALVEHYVGLGHDVGGCSRDAVGWELDGYVHYGADVTDEGAMHAAFGDVWQRFGRLDHLINNAGIASMNHSLLTPVSTFERILRTNVVGTFLASREAAKLMKRRGFGRIVNVSSVAVPLKVAGEGPYVAAKAAINSLTHVLARELADFGITVNTVGPTPVDTDLIRGIPGNKLEELIALQAIPRMGTPKDVANAIDFFLRQESDFITGQTLYLGGV